MSRRDRRITWGVVLLTTFAAFVYACGPEITFRAYLSKALWRPTLRPIADLLRGLPPEKTQYTAYAGMASKDGSAGMNALRQAYSDLFPDRDFSKMEWRPQVIENLENLLRAVQPAPGERDEVDLLRCKIELRAAHIGNDSGLAAAQACFESYLGQPHSPAFASEARGWLARTLFLRNERPAAAKIYLDELSTTNSNIRRERLLTSLAMLYPDTEDKRFEELKADIDQYFDTPAHALFIADRVTNSDFTRQGQPGVDAYLELLKQLEAHKDLFGQGSQSDALALEMMRGTIRAGAPTKTLEYAGMVPGGSATRRDPEFYWLVGAANFELANYRTAESSLKRVVESKNADGRQRAFAWNGLIGVYERTQQPLEELHAAFQNQPIVLSSMPAPLDDDLGGAGLLGWNLDIAYLLDVQLMDRQLEEYLKRYPDGHAAALMTDYPRKRTASELVRYALAVRHARHEEFREAARLYRQLSAMRRAKRMEEAANLFARTQQTAASGAEHLQALYNYAQFLSNNEDGIFFNDSVWHRFQTWAFMPDTDRRIGLFGIFNYKVLSPAEAATYRTQERKLRDDEDEYWRAFQILDRIVTQAGHTELGKNAAVRALFCLRRISPERFGRQREIRAADIRLSNWLAR